MKIYIFILFVILSTFTGRPATLAQQPLTEKYKEIVLPIKIKNDSNEVKYFKEINRTEVLYPKLILKVQRLEKEILQKDKEIKRLNNLATFFKNNIDTIQIHDTIFKKRKGIFNFLRKNKN